MKDKIYVELCLFMVYIYLFVIVCIYLNDLFYINFIGKVYIICN